MAETPKQLCPLCGRQVPVSARYPGYVCDDCAMKATDEENRPLRFYNESLSGGFVARYADTGEERRSHVCFVDGVRCWADEAHLGGIVIQAAPESDASQIGGH
jgi:predicted amidophosphoribosyltransferase